MRKIQRRMAAGLLAFGVLAGLPAAAQASEKVDDFDMRFEFTVNGVNNPCTPQLDDITLDGSGRVMGKMWRDDDGSMRALSTMRVRLDGDAADGTGYVGHSEFKAHTEIEGDVAHISTDAKHLLVSQGADPNFFLRYKINVTFDLVGTGSTVEVVKDQAECRG